MSALALVCCLWLSAAPGAEGRGGQQALGALLPPFPGGGQRTPIDGRQVFHGIPMDLSAFETARPVAEVIAFYAAHFERMGWQWWGPASTSSWVPYPAVSATHPSLGVQLSVIAMPHRQGKGCTVILGLADMDPAARLPHDPGISLPVFPGAQAATVWSKEPEAMQVSVSFTTSAPPQQVRDFYLQVLARQGWAQRPTGDALELLEFSAPGRSWVLSIAGGKGGGTSVVAHGRERLAEAAQR